MPKYRVLVEVQTCKRVTLEIGALDKWDAERAAERQLYGGRLPLDYPIDEDATVCITATEVS